MSHPDDEPGIPLDAVLRAFQESVDRARRTVRRAHEFKDGTFAEMEDHPVYGINSVEVELPARLFVAPESRLGTSAERMSAFATFDAPAEERGVIKFRVEALPRYADQDEAEDIAARDEAQYAEAHERRRSARQRDEEH